MKKKNIFIRIASAMSLMLLVSSVQIAAQNINIVYNVTDVSCYGDNDGAINLGVTGGSGNYTYSWSNGEGTQDLTDLTAGIYTVTVTDGSNNTATKSIEVTEPYECNDGNIYTIDGCQNGECSFTLIPGYCNTSLDCDDNDNCTDDYCDFIQHQCQHLAVPPGCCGSVSIIRHDNDPCLDQGVLLTLQQNFPGTVSLYQWNTGETTPSITVFPPAGFYNFYGITVTTVDGCSFTDAIYIIKSDPQIEITVDNPDLNCAGSIVELNMRMDGSFAGNPIVMWSNGSDNFSTSVALSQGVNTYSVTVTDENGCEFADQVSITAIDCPCNTPIDVSLDVSDHVLCTNESETVTISSSDNGQINGYFYSPQNPHIDDGNLDHLPNNPQVMTIDAADIDFPRPSTADICFVRVLQTEDEFCSTESCVQITFLDETCDNHPSPCDNFNLNTSFTWSKLPVTADNPQHTYGFTSASTIAAGLQILYVTWDFGDGSPNEYGNPYQEHTFSGSAPYHVCLTIHYIDPNTNYCCSDMQCHDIPPNPCDDLDIDVGINSHLLDPDNDPATDPFTFEFTAVVQQNLPPLQPNYPIEQYLWDFGDGTPVMPGGATMPHTFAEAGTFNVCVTAIITISEDPAICCTFTGCNETCINDPNGVNGHVQQRCINTQPNSLEGMDAMILTSNTDATLATSNHGNYECLMADAASTGLKFRSLIEFNLSEIKVGSPLDGATLTLFITQCASQNNLGSGTVLIRRIITPWKENTVTWSNQPTTTNMNEVSLSTNMLNMEGQTAVDIKALVEDMLSDRENSHGLMLMVEDEGAQTGVSFGSSDNFDANVRPKLEVCYLYENSTGSSSLSDESKIIIYPNPSKGVFCVKLGNITGNQRSLQVIAVSGRVILEIKDSKDIETLDLSKFTNGIYIVKVATSSISFFKRVAKL